MDRSPLKSACCDTALTSALVDARTFLGMERTGETTWSFEVTERVITPGNFLFGGCGLASALVALEGASGRPTIWATAQYLSYAPLGSTVTVKTDLAVIGGHVTQARATTYAEDREILTVNSAFGTGELAAPTPWVTMPEVKPPLECAERVMPERFNRSIFNHLDARIALGRPFEQIDGTPGSPVSRTPLALRSLKASPEIEISAKSPKSTLVKASVPSTTWKMEEVVGVVAVEAGVARLSVTS